MAGRNYRALFCHAALRSRRRSNRGFSPLQAVLAIPHYVRNHQGARVRRGRGRDRDIPDRDSHQQAVEVLEMDGGFHCDGKNVEGTGSASEAWDAVGTRSLRVMQCDGPTILEGR
jgi:hypothetical protein